MLTTAAHLAAQHDTANGTLSAIHEARHEVLMRLAIAAEYRDEATEQHMIRLGYMAEKLSALLGESDEFCYLMRLAAPMHDVGNIGLPEALLKNPSSLNAEERALMNTHTEIGFKILTQADAPLFQLAASIALTHHETFDGTGYPKQLAGHAIPLAGRIVALVDYFDALTMDKPYRASFSDAQAIEMVQAQSGKLFDPDMVNVFIANIESFIQLRHSINASPMKYDQLVNYSHATFL
jgi:putative two-component system response regulator